MSAELPEKENPEERNSEAETPKEGGPDREPPTPEGEEGLGSDEIAMPEEDPPRERSGEGDASEEEEVSDRKSLRERAERLRQEGGEEERIRFMDGVRYISYPFAKKVVRHLERLFHYPRQPRMPCVLIAGESGNGKTWIAQRFLAKHPEESRPEEEADYIPVAIMEAPGRPVLGDFYDELADGLGIDDYKSGYQVGRKRHITSQVLKGVGTRVLIIDELHHVISGRGERQKTMLREIKSLSNKHQLPIAGFGIRKALKAIRKNKQVSSRFEQQWSLPKWTMNDTYMMLLASFEAILPLKNESGLANGKGNPLAKKVLKLSEGTIGEIDKVLKAATARAIRTGEEKITEKVLKEIVENRDYAPPSKQNKEGRNRIDNGEGDNPNDDEPNNE